MLRSLAPQRFTAISLVTASFGYQDQPNVPSALRLAREAGLDIDVDHASYFLSRITINLTGRRRPVPLTDGPHRR